MKQLTAFISKTRGKVAVAMTALLGSLFSAAAFAQSTGMGSTAAGKIDSALPQIELVQTAMLAILIALVVFSLIRRSFGK
ncbi:hypothetical protein [Luteimonas panaciterrae]|uniref:hypothetical protein n=1 Tax=Luteimonas panaciterrae TaxID=363885 RepID=UPI001CFA39D5|nr:hypothetical protein [Luteimonas panaciterrae]